MPRLRIVYDGECPFCSRYVQMVRLKAHFTLELVDARKHPALARSYGLDLDRGMIADQDGQVHHGADAMWFIAQASRRPGLFANRTFARRIYPTLRTGRNAVLRLLGRKLIRSA